MIKRAHVYLSHSQNGRFFTQTILETHAWLLVLALTELMTAHAPIKIVSALTLYTNQPLAPYQHFPLSLKKQPQCFRFHTPKSQSP